jgi:hypothetical protein
MPDGQASIVPTAISAKVGAGNFAMPLLRAAAFSLLAGFSALAAAGDRLLVAPGKSVRLVNAADPSLRVVLTAPADRPLDVSALIGGMRASELYSLATRMPAHANALMRNPDGSVALGATVAAAPPGAMLQNGVIVVDRGTVAHYPEAPAAASAPNPMENALRRMNEPPVKGPVNLVGAPAGALFLPTGIRVR